MAIIMLKKPISSLSLVAFITTIFLILLSSSRVVNSADSLSFSFNDFTPDGSRDLIFQGDAYVTPKRELQLTKTDDKGVPQQNTAGRVLYSAEVQLWEKSTGRVAFFETTINFVLSSPSATPADGIAFFITTPDSTIPKNTDGGYFGLFNSTTAFEPFANQIVLVEFDTFHNTWDPGYQHIGINVNTIESAANVKWQSINGTLASALINYIPITEKLSVVLSYPGSDLYEVSYDVDLTQVLPEWVRVGITGASGLDVQVHTINSWYFTSALQYTNKAKKGKKEDMYIARVV